ncbi:MAG: hypothetical protein IRY91_17455, partial [Gemmatimonadaceae bacterium]|nr:hypothetical protein [Gemmatimonadaceae bacterium]
AATRSGRAGAAAVAAAGALVAGCSSTAGGAGHAGESGVTPVAVTTVGDTTRLGDIPPGYGSLRQEDLSVSVRLPLVLVRLMPLDESVIRLLSPDSYRALRELRDGHRDAIVRSAQRVGVERPSLWYVSFFGLAPDARFTARDVDVLSGGRDFRPLDVIPLTAGFGEETVGQRQVQSAIYVFAGGINPNQPLAIRVESRETTDWGAVIPIIERERALVRSRAAARP